MFYLYILYSLSKDKFYIGITDNLARRLEQHNSGRNLSTKFGVPWLLKYSEVYKTRSATMKRESEIKKKKRRSYLEWLINK